MSQRKNRLIFSWIFPEITMLGNIYDIDWINNTIKQAIGTGRSGIDTMEFVKRLLTKVDRFYDRKDVLLVESHILSLAIGDEPYLVDTSLEYFTKIDNKFEELIKDSRKGHIRFFGNKFIPTQDFNTTFSSHIYTYLQAFRISFYRILGERHTKVITLGRNVIIEYDDIDNCTMMETIIQCSKVSNIQFLPHII